MEPQGHRCSVQIRQTAQENTQGQSRGLICRKQWRQALPFALLLVDVYQHHKNQNMMSSWQLLKQNVLKLKELVSGMSGLRCLAGLSDTCRVFFYTLSPKCPQVSGYHRAPQSVSLKAVTAVVRSPACGLWTQGKFARCQMQESYMPFFFFPGSNWKPTEWHLSPSPAALL